jgi:hypothetical protein
MILDIFFFKDCIGVVDSIYILVSPESFEKIVFKDYYKKPYPECINSL